MGHLARQRSVPVTVKGTSYLRFPNVTFVVASVAEGASLLWIHRQVDGDLAAVPAYKPVSRLYVVATDYGASVTHLRHLEAMSNATGRTSFPRSLC